MHFKKHMGIETPLYPEALPSKVTARGQGTLCKRDLSVSNMNKKYNLHLLSISEYQILFIEKYSRDVLTILIVLTIIY